MSRFWRGLYEFGVDQGNEQVEDGMQKVMELLQVASYSIFSKGDPDRASDRRYHIL